MQKGIAIILHAGIGGGFFSQGQPVIGKFVEQLALEYDVTVYSQLPPNVEFTGSNFYIYSAPLPYTPYLEKSVPFLV